MQSMFNLASSFNNNNSNTISSWSATLCQDFSFMFASAFNFNQPLTNLLSNNNVTKITNNMFQNARTFNQNLNSWNMSKTTTIADMFSGSTNYSIATKFNNGEPIPSSISGTINSASFTNSTNILSCPNALFLTELSVNDVLIIRTSSIQYSSSIQSITNNTTLVLTTAYGSNISSGIVSIVKQIHGTNPLTWDMGMCTNTKNAFRLNATFNQNTKQSKL
jgi:hypothetical protein